MAIKKVGPVVEKKVSSVSMKDTEHTERSDRSVSTESSGRSQTYEVKRDTSDEKVLQLNVDSNVILIWSEDSFRELPESVELQLKPQNMRNYLKVKMIIEARVKNVEEKAIVSNDDDLDDMEFMADYRLRTRERRGWHTYWAAPGPDFDRCIASGHYKQIRKQLEGEDREPGYENGEVLKLLDGEGKVELIALECPMEYYQKRIQRMATKSQERYAANKEAFASVVEEEINVRAPREARMNVYDENGRIG
jgi:hypothetical protein